MSLKVTLDAPLESLMRPRRRYYNTTYNSRHGKRKNLHASSYIKNIEEETRRREKAIEKRIQAFEADSKMISERALARTVMDDRTDGVGQFPTKKNMPITREFIEMRNRTNNFKKSVRSLMCLNEAITAMKSNVKTMPEKTPPIRKNRSHAVSYLSSSGSSNSNSKMMPPKKKPRIPPLPLQQEHHSMKPPSQRTSTLVKLPSIPVSFRSLEHKGGALRPISYSDFLLGQSFGRARSLEKS